MRTKDIVKLALVRQPILTYSLILLLGNKFHCALKILLPSKHACNCGYTHLTLFCSTFPDRRNGKIFKMRFLLHSQTITYLHATHTSPCYFLMIVIAFIFFQPLHRACGWIGPSTEDFHDCLPL